MSMSKIVALLPGMELYMMAEKLITRENIAIDQIECVTIEDVGREAQKAKASGAKIIVARGNQATVAKQLTQLEVIEIVLTAQELAILIRRAIEKSGKERPTIAVIGWSNMVCDVSHFDTLFNINLRLFLASDLAELGVLCNRAIEEKVDVVVGDPIAVSEAGMAGIPSIHWMPTEDSLRIAFKTAEKLRTFLDAEQTAMAQMNTLMDTSSNGIIRLDPKGTMLSINRRMEELLDRRAVDCIGINVTEVINLDSDELQQILLTGIGNYSSYLRIKNTAVLAVITPVCTGDFIQGAILSCNQIKGFANLEGDMLRSQFFKGYVAGCTFDDLVTSSGAMQKQIQLAKRFAMSKSPVIIYGETGTETTQVAQSIHNSSRAKNGSFVEIDLSGLSSDMQARLLFGDEDAKANHSKRMLGALEVARHGTLFIKQIDCLSLQNQYRLLGAVIYKNNGAAFSQVPNSDIRIIAECNCDLYDKVSEAEFREDLYYLLSGLSIHLPPLRERREDIKILWQQSMEAYLQLYDTYRVLTVRALQMIENYYWPGNAIQLDRLCERLVVGTVQRSIGEELVREALEDFGSPLDGLKNKLEIERKNGDSIETVRRLLEKYSGNRQNTAKELGVSTTTLWRFMKKNGIDYAKGQNDQTI